MKVPLSIFVAVLISIGLFELLYDKRVTVSDRGDHWTGRFSSPYAHGATHTQTFEEYVAPLSRTDTQVRSVTYIYDQFGMRAKDKLVDYNFDTNLAIVGDSFAHGDEVDYYDSLQGLLERELPAINIFNFGKGGSSSEYYAETIENYLKEIRRSISLMVIGLYTDMSIGDLPRILAVHQFGDRMYFNGIPVGPSLYQRLTQSAVENYWFVLQTTARKYSSTFNLLFPPTSAKDFAVDLKGTLRRDMFPGMSDALMSNLRRAGAMADLTPDKIIVWLIPSNNVLEEMYVASSQHRPVHDFIALTQEFWDLISRRLVSAGYRVVDTRQRIYSLFLDKGVYPFTVSGHFRPVAYKETVNAISLVVGEMLGDTKGHLQSHSEAIHCEIRIP